MRPATARHAAAPPPPVYLAGLDLGQVHGPLLGGAGAVGVGSTFLPAGIVLPPTYLALSALLRRRAIAGPDAATDAPFTLA